jgi:hypothetical protein
MPIAVYGEQFRNALRLFLSRRIHFRPVDFPMPVLMFICPRIFEE